MSCEYRGCELLSRGRFGPVTVLWVPMMMFRWLKPKREVCPGQTTDAVSASKVFEGLFHEAFGKECPNLNLTSISGACIVGMHSDVVWSDSDTIEVVLPQDVDNGMDRVRRFIDLLHDNKKR